jgi:HEAT repeat protein
MPIQFSNFPFSRLTSRIISLAAAGILIFGVAHSANAAIQDAQADDGFSWIFSTYGITIFLLVMLVGLVVYKKWRNRQEAAELKDAEPVRGSAKEDRREAFVEAESGVSANGNGHAMAGVQVWEKPAEAEASVFGAYRIDQEVNKLVQGKPHRMDVMASRASDDRRAIEASLLKAIESSDTTEDGRRRARHALEEYGFVARQSATMLMGRDAWERSSAARALGQIGAQSSLSFLIEALHDHDSVVRNQAISSLGSLKMPSAIGALLDIARRHPEIPASLLSETLSACSVESLGYLDAPSSEPALLSTHAGENEPAELERFVSFEDLPMGAEDTELSEAIDQLEGSDDRARASLAQELALHPVQRSVETLTSLVMNDPDPAVRSAAVSSLGSIDHESVFGPVLIGLADESRIVRAAAARTLTSLHFDRADAYVRVMETADPEMLKKVAQACVETGIVAQGIDRLASEDRRQAYEAFSLFSLLARANKTEPIMTVIETHQDEEVRLCAVRVLNVAGQAELVPKLRELVGKDSLPESVRTAVLEVLYKLDQDEPLIDLEASDNEPVTLHNSE